MSDAPSMYAPVRRDAMLETLRAIQRDVATLTACADRVIAATVTGGGGTGLIDDLHTIDGSAASIRAQIARIVALDG